MRPFSTVYYPGSLVFPIFLSCNSCASMKFETKIEEESYLSYKKRDRRSYFSFLFFILTHKYK